jgi:hypothetical protein
MQARAVALVGYSFLDAPVSVPPVSLNRFLWNSMRGEPGLVDCFGCLEESSGAFVWVTLWKTADDASRFEAHCAMGEALRWACETV